MAFRSVALRQERLAECAEHALKLGYDIEVVECAERGGARSKRAVVYDYAGILERSCRSGMFFASSSFGIFFLTSNFPPSTRLM
jgi:hypothetical protein